MDRDVDFVVGAPPPPGPPDEQRPPSRNRRRWLVALAAVVVLVGVVVAVRSTGSSRGPSAASSAPSVDDRSLVTTPSPEAVPSLGCTQFAACSLSHGVPGNVLAAVRARFPRARTVSAQTVLLRRDNAPSAEIRARYLRFRAGTVTISVQVSTPGAGNDDAPVPVGTRTVIRTASTGQYVTVEAAAPAADQLPSYALLQALVGDARLLAT